MRTISVCLTVLALAWCASRAQAEEGPHGGELYANSNHTIHAEFVHERNNNKVIVYVLDGKAKDEVPVPAKVVTISVKGKNKIILLKPVNHKDGKASRYELVHDFFGEKLDTAGIKLSMCLTEGKPEEEFHLEKD